AGSRCNTATTGNDAVSLHDALPIFELKPETLGGTLGRPIFIVALPFVAAVAKLIENILHEQELRFRGGGFPRNLRPPIDAADLRSEEHTSELQSRDNLVCRLLLEQQ